jgi:dienelactone hydrolase
MLCERTSYHPKPGRFDAVLALRHEACAVRREIGLAGGEVYVEEGEGGPSVHWECRFADAAAHADDMARRDESPAFGAVRGRMQDLIEDFQRRIYLMQPGPTLRSVTLDGVPIVPQAVTIPSDGRDLAGFLYLPPGPGPHPAMVMNHGSGIFQGTSELCRPGVAALLMSWGVAALLVHRRGYGNSPGTPWRGDVSAEYGTEDYDRQLARRLADESRDVVAALDWLQEQPGIDAAHVGVMGSSFGGTVTLLAAAACPRFRCAVEFAGAAMNWERAPGLRRLMLDQAATLTRPIYFIQAANDYSTAPTVELAEAARAAGVTVEARVWPGFGLSQDEGHYFYREGPQIWGPEVRRFLERWL